MSGHGEKRTRKQEAALAALLSEPTMAAAAAKAGVHRCTLVRWLKDADFKAAYAEVRRRAVDHGLATMQAGLALAVQTLAEAMADADLPAADRIRAADAFLKHALKGIETLDLMERLQAVEARLDAYAADGLTRPTRAHRERG